MYLVQRNMAELFMWFPFFGIRNQIWYMLLQGDLQFLEELLSSRNKKHFSLCILFSLPRLMGTIDNLKSIPTSNTRSVMENREEIHFKLESMEKQAREIAQKKLELNKDKEIFGHIGGNEEQRVKSIEKPLEMPHWNLLCLRRIGLFVYIFQCSKNVKLYNILKLRCY